MSCWSLGKIRTDVARIQFLVVEVVMTLLNHGHSYKWIIPLQWKSFISKAPEILAYNIFFSSTCKDKERWHQKPLGPFAFSTPKLIDEHLMS